MKFSAFTAFLLLQVDQLILQVAEENGLEVMDQLAELNPASQSLAPAAAAKSKSSEDELDRRYLFAIVTRFYHSTG